MELLTIIFLGSGIIINSVFCYFLTRGYIILKGQVEEIERKRNYVYEMMTNPDKIAEDMERGARLREMRDAHRTTLPRDDQVGQHARVFRPKIQRKDPSHWNPKP